LRTEVLQAVKTNGNGVAQTAGVAVESKPLPSGTRAAGDVSDDA